MLRARKRTRERLRSGNGSSRALFIASGPCVLGGDGSSGALGPIWLAYGEATGTMGVRAWNDSAWSAEQHGPNVGGDLVRRVVPRETPFGSFIAVLSTGATNHLDVFERKNDGTWQLGLHESDEHRRSA
jgi:hypothetical protein